MTSPPTSPSNELWAITTYFNPMHFKRRLTNFKTFRSRLNVPLVAVELSYGSDFELDQQDADIVVRLSGRSVLWQKERLLNVALEALPLQCRKVAWLDCDIFFASAEWSDQAKSLLNQFALIQLFRKAYYLSPDWMPGTDPASSIDFHQASSIFGLRSDTPAAMILARRFGGRRNGFAPGFAWAARRDALDRHRFYDAGIIGGGDRAMVCAAHGCSDELAELHLMNDAQRRKYSSWAKSFYQTIRAETACLDTDIYHLWHGDYSLRRTRGRFEGLQRFGFDPEHDIAMDHNGVWRWNSDKHEMHEYVRDYFASRREDDVLERQAVAP